jgi:hypothetical protein
MPLETMSPCEQWVLSNDATGLVGSLLIDCWFSTVLQRHSHAETLQIDRFGDGRHYCPIIHLFQESPGR